MVRGNGLEKIRKRSWVRVRGGSWFQALLTPLLCKSGRGGRGGLAVSEAVLVRPPSGGGETGIAVVEGGGVIVEGGLCGGVGGGGFRGGGDVEFSSPALVV